MNRKERNDRLQRDERERSPKQPRGSRPAFRPPVVTEVYYMLRGSKSLVGSAAQK